MKNIVERLMNFWPNSAVSFHIGREEFDTAVLEEDWEFLWGAYEYAVRGGESSTLEMREREIKHLHTEVEELRKERDRARELEESAKAVTRRLQGEREEQIRKLVEVDAAAQAEGEETTPLVSVAAVTVDITEGPTVPRMDAEGRLLLQCPDCGRGWSPEAALKLSLEKEGELDHWGAYECFACFHERGGSGVCFDVRVPGWAPDKVACPVCGEECKLRSQWLATQDGYGSRSEKEGIDWEGVAWINAESWSALETKYHLALKLLHEARVTIQGFTVENIWLHEQYDLLLSQAYEATTAVPREKYHLALELLHEEHLARYGLFAFIPALQADREQAYRALGAFSRYSLSVNAAGILVAPMGDEKLAEVLRRHCHILERMRLLGYMNEKEEGT